MKISDLIKCERNKTVFGKRQPGFTATDIRDTVKVSADTKEQAMQKVGAILIDQAYFASPSYYFTQDGAMWVLYYAYGNWAYDIVRPRPNFPNNQGRTSTCITNAKSRDQALAQMLAHKCQYDENLAHEVTS